MSHRGQRQRELAMCLGFGWARVSFLHSS